MISELFNRPINPGDIVIFPSYGRYLDFGVVEHVPPMTEGKRWNEGLITAHKVNWKWADADKTIKKYTKRKIDLNDRTVFVMDPDDYFNSTNEDGEKIFVTQLIEKYKNGPRI